MTGLSSTQRAAVLLMRQHGHLSPFHNSWSAGHRIFANPTIDALVAKGLAIKAYPRVTLTARGRSVAAELAGEARP